MCVHEWWLICIYVCESWVFVHVYECMHKNVWTCRHMWLSILYMCAYMCTYECLHVYTCRCLYMYGRLCVSTHGWHVYMCVFMCRWMCLCVRGCAFVYVCVGRCGMCLIVCKVHMRWMDGWTDVVVSWLWVCEKKFCSLWWERSSQTALQSWSWWPHSPKQPNMPFPTLTRSCPVAASTVTPGLRGTSGSFLLEQLYDSAT